MSSIIWEPIRITSASFVKIRKSGMRADSRNRTKTTEIRKSSLKHTSTLFFTLSYLRAPKFCPTNVVMEMPIAPLIIQNTASSFP